MPLPTSTAAGAIRIRGARTHNLCGIDVDIPLETLTVITGVSGSGKSSLAFDTLFAEGRRRYLATVSPQTRALLQRLERPEVDLIEGLPPTLGIEQRTRGPRRRTTVATIAEVYDYLRLLYSRTGRLHCPTCHQPVSSQSRETIVNQALRLEDRQKVLILAPIRRGQNGSHAEVFARIVRDGFVRARVDGELVDAASPPSLVATKPHSIEVVVDRLIIKEGIRTRLEESIDLALELGQGQCLLSHESDGQWQDRLYSSRLACATCGVSFPTLEPSDFSFNSVRGACATCHGLGVVATAIEGVEGACPTCVGRRLAPLPQSVLIAGRSITDIVALRMDEALRCIDEWSKLLIGKLPANTVSGEELQQTCSPWRMQPASELTLAASATAVIPMPALIQTVRELTPPGSPDPWNDVADQLAARHILPEVASRLRFLVDVGLDYLTLDRAGESLSAGEFQRARLAASLGSQLTGACYVVDEPTAGLHPHDTGRLLQTLFDLRDQGNTVVIVEHDLGVIQQADHVIDIGPGAGAHGGQLLATGSPNMIALDENSITGRALRRRRTDASSVPMRPRDTTPFEPTSWLTLSGVTQHNLQDVTLRLPLGGLVCVSGVSGSGKTSLIMQTLVPAIRRALGEVAPVCGSFRELLGVEAITRVVRVDQMPLGRSGRSTPATYSGLWDELRQVFAKTKESRLRGFTARRFSPQSLDGRCSHCLGRGTLTLDKKSLLDWTQRCPECNGARFNRQTLAVRYRGQTVADVLDMSFESAADFFANLPRLARSLTLFRDLGLGYLKLGQPATTLSGGEAQRVKLASELVTSHETTATLFVLDEPTSGLHASDVAQLLQVLKRLVHAGHSVLVVEHNLELLAAVDWLIDIGPDAGERGGRIVAEGPPSDVANCELSHTGNALRQMFSICGFGSPTSHEPEA